MNIDHMPHAPGVYIFRDRQNQILYIGKAKNLYKRVSQYYAPNTLRKRDMTAKADHVDFLLTDSDEEAILLETNLIGKHKPPYNRLIKWDNSYIYIKIEKSNYPNIYMTRYRANDGAIYIWPKQFRNELKNLLSIFRQLFGYRSCKKTLFEAGKLCSDYFFGLCKWRCVYNKLWSPKQDIYIQNANRIWFKFIENNSLTQISKESDEDKSDNISDIKKSKTSTAQQFYILQYEQIIKYIVDFFGGEDDKIKNFIRDEINKCIKSQNFEWAAKLRDIYNNMDKFATTKQSIYLPNPMSGQFWEIRQAGAHYIYVIVNYQIGKIVDILRFDEKMEDADYDSILAKIKLEFGEMKVKKKNGYIYGWCKELEPTEEDIKTIYGQINNFVDSHILSSVYKKDNIMWDLLATLQRRYNLTKYPYNIECLDISHLSGGRASWAISSTQWWLPYKKWYRQYKIKVAPGDDFASIKEVLIRRFDSRKTDKYNYLPDLFVIDWWLWQLNVAKKLLSEYIYIYQNVQFVALWKWTARKSSSKNFGAKETLYILDSDEQIRKIELVYDDTDRIMTKIRDEAHRFSNRYRKKQMEMEIR